MQTPGPGCRGLLPLFLFGLLLLFPAGCSSDPFLHKKGRNCLKLEPGRREGRINGTLVYLTTPAGAGGEVTGTDRKTVIEPLLSMTPRLKRPLRTIVIDPGHGGRETGAPGTLHQEKELNLALARKLRAELEKRGCRVIMTRDDDRFLPLNARGDLPGERDADLFLSIHHNSARDKTVSGAEIYLLTPDGVPSTNDPADSRPPAVPQAARSLWNDMILAREIQSRLIAKSGLPDRGIRFARFRVLVRSACPALLVEAGFISNPEEEKKLADPTAQQRTAEAIADGVDAFRNRAKIGG